MGLVEKTEDGTLEIKDVKDTPPKKRVGRPPGSKSQSKSVAAETKQIEEALTKALTAPSIAFAMAGDDFCAKHFEDQAPVLAKELAKASEKYPQWRKYFLLAPSTSENLTLFVAIFGFVYAPIAHHVPGVPRLPALETMGIPVPPENDSPNQLTREMVEEAMREAQQTGQTLTPAAEQMVRDAGFGDILDTAAASVQAASQEAEGEPSE